MKIAFVKDSNDKVIKFTFDGIEYELKEATFESVILEIINEGRGILLSDDTYFFFNGRGGGGTIDLRREEGLIILKEKLGLAPVPPDFEVLIGDRWYYYRNKVWKWGMLNTRFIFKNYTGNPKHYGGARGYARLDGNKVYVDGVDATKKKVHDSFFATDYFGRKIKWIVGARYLFRVGQAQDAPINRWAEIELLANYKFKWIKTWEPTLPGFAHPVYDNVTNPNLTWEQLLANHRTTSTVQESATFATMEVIWQNV